MACVQRAGGHSYKQYASRKTDYHLNTYVLTWESYGKNVSDYACERRECEVERSREHDQSRDRWRNMVNKRMVLHRPVRKKKLRQKGRNNIWLSEDAGQIV